MLDSIYAWTTMGWIICDPDLWNMYSQQYTNMIRYLNFIYWKNNIREKKFTTRKAANEEAMKKKIAYGKAIAYNSIHSSKQIFMTCVSINESSTYASLNLVKSLL